MTQRHASTRSGPAPATKGQYWCAGLSVAAAVVTCLHVGFPSYGPSTGLPMDHTPSPSVSSYGQYSSENYNYPNVNGPNVRSRAGKVWRAVR